MQRIDRTVDSYAHIETVVQRTLRGQPHEIGNGRPLVIGELSANDDFPITL